MDESPALRPYESEDIAALRFWYRDPSMMHWLGGCPQLARMALRYRSFVLVDAESVVGLVICDDERTAETMTISFAVAPSARGRGYGQQILALLPLRPELADVELFEAHVEQRNRASTRCFEAAGWQDIDEELDDVLLHAYQLRRSPVIP